MKSWTDILHITIQSRAYALLSYRSFDRESRPGGIPYPLFDIILIITKATVKGVVL